MFYIAVTSYWTRWRHKSPASRLFTQAFIQSQIKETIKATCHWHLCGEFTGEFPAQMGSNAVNVSIWWRHHELTVSPIWYSEDFAEEQSFLADLSTFASLLHLKENKRRLAVMIRSWVKKILFGLYTDIVKIALKWPDNRDILMLT